LATTQSSPLEGAAKARHVLGHPRGEAPAIRPVSEFMLHLTNNNSKSPRLLVANGHGTSAHYC
jgi:hypothetical protein